MECCHPWRGGSTIAAASNGKAQDRDTPRVRSSECFIYISHCEAALLEDQTQTRSWRTWNNTIQYTVLSLHSGNMVSGYLQSICTRGSSSWWVWWCETWSPWMSHPKGNGSNRSWGSRICICHPWRAEDRQWFGMILCLCTPHRGVIKGQQQQLLVSSFFFSWGHGGSAEPSSPGPLCCESRRKNDDRFHTFSIYEERGVILSVLPEVHYKFFWFVDSHKMRWALLGGIICRWCVG